jgi:hypothetical protein
VLAGLEVGDGTGAYEFAVRGDTAGSEDTAAAFSWADRELNALLGPDLFDDFDRYRRVKLASSQ